MSINRSKETQILLPREKLVHYDLHDGVNYSDPELVYWTIGQIALDSIPMKSRDLDRIASPEFFQQLILVQLMTLIRSDAPGSDLPQWLKFRNDFGLPYDLSMNTTVTSRTLTKGKPEKYRDVDDLSPKRIQGRAKMLPRELLKPPKTGEPTVKLFGLYQELKDNPRPTIAVVCELSYGLDQVKFKSGVHHPSQVRYDRLADHYPTLSVPSQYLADFIADFYDPVNYRSSQEIWDEIHRDLAWRFPDLHPFN